MRRALVALLLLCAVVAASAHAEPKLQRFKSRHYLIHTDLSRDEVIDFGRHMDAIFDQYTRRFSGFPPQGSDVRPLYLLRHRSDYESLLLGHGIDPTNSGGMFFVRPGLQGLATWTSGRGRSETLAVLQHEGFHQFAWTYLGANLPHWLNEGLAQYFEDAILVDGRMTLGVADAMRIEQVRGAIEAGQAIPFDSLLTLRNDHWASALNRDAAASALLYAQSWSLTWFLIHADDGRYQRALERYLWMLSGGSDPDRAFRSAFGVNNYAPVETRWKRFALTQQPDPLGAAVERLDFLGSALQYLAENNGPTFASFDHMREYLQAVQFTLTRSSHGVAQIFNATDDDLFVYPRGGGAVGAYRLLEPSRADLPPRVTAPGLSPEPTLVWSRDDRGQLMRDIVFR